MSLIFLRIHTINYKASLLTNSIICRGVVVIASANGKEDRGFESSQGVSFDDFILFYSVLGNLTPITIVLI
jgi:hypothetical protein